MHDIMSTPQVAEMLGVDRSAVVRMAQRGDIPASKASPGLRSPYLFRRADVERVARERAAA